MRENGPEPDPIQSVSIFLDYGWIWSVINNIVINNGWVNLVENWTQTDLFLKKMYPKRIEHEVSWKWIELVVKLSVNLSLRVVHTVIDYLRRILHNFKKGKTKMSKTNTRELLETRENYCTAAQGILDRKNNGFEMVPFERYNAAVKLRSPKRNAYYVICHSNTHHSAGWLVCRFAKNGG